MKQNSEYRAEARQALEGKWGDAAIYIIVAFVVVLLIEGLEVACGLLGNIFNLLLLPIEFATVAPFLGLLRGKELKVSQMFGYFKELRVWLVELIKTIIILFAGFVAFLPFMVIVGIMAMSMNIDFSSIMGGHVTGADNTNFALLLAIFFIGYVVAIVAGAYVSYCYQMVEFLMTDDKSLSEMAALRASNKMMKGKKWKMFLLDLSFIGWLLLCLLTCGLGFILLAPYVDTAHAAFYEDLKAELEPQPEEVPAV